MANLIHVDPESQRERDAKCVVRLLKILCLLYSLTGVQVALVWSLSSLWGLSTVMSQYLEMVPWMAEWQSGTPGYETGDLLVPGENSQAKKLEGVKPKNKFLPNHVQTSVLV